MIFGWHMPGCEDSWPAASKPEGADRRVPRFDIVSAMLRRIPLSLILSGAISASVFGAGDADTLMTKPEKVGMSSERLARIGKRMQEYIDQNKVAGTVTLVARHGKI